MEKKEKCSFCQNIFDDGSCDNINGELVCEDCLKTHFMYCNHCSEYTPADDSLMTASGDTICADCYSDNFFSCERCENIFHSDERYNYDGCDYCERCYHTTIDEEDEGGGVNTRAIDLDSNEFQGIQKSRIIASPRKFGVEIETIYPDTDSLHSIIKELPRCFGIAQDASISHGSGFIGGIEIQTPPIALNKGEKILRKTCDILKTHGLTINASCGLHVHLDTPELKGDDTMDKFNKIKKLFLFYLIYDDCLFSMLPDSRKTNQYCIRLGERYHYHEILNATDRDELELIWYRAVSGVKEVRERKANRYEQTRYLGANFHSLLAQNHIEIRHHSGTINAKKMLYWISLHQTILDKVLGEVLYLDKIADGKNIFDLREKLLFMFEILEVKTNAKKYFLKRYATFSGKKRKVLDNNEKTICAE